jgi:hypothetical protein
MGEGSAATRRRDMTPRIAEDITESLRRTIDRETATYPAPNCRVHL